MHVFKPNIKITVNNIIICFCKIRLHYIDWVYISLSYQYYFKIALSSPNNTDRQALYEYIS